MPKNTPLERAKRGPVPKRLKLEGKWEDAVKKSLNKKKPPEGWPKEQSTENLP